MQSGITRAPAMLVAVALSLLAAVLLTGCSSSVVGDWTLGDPSSNPTGSATFDSVGTVTVRDDSGTYEGSYNEKDDERIVITIQAGSDSLSLEYTWQRDDMLVTEYDPDFTLWRGSQDDRMAELDESDGDQTTEESYAESASNAEAAGMPPWANEWMEGFEDPEALVGQNGRTLDRIVTLEDSSASELARLAGEAAADHLKGNVPDIDQASLAERAADFEEMAREDIAYLQGQNDVEAIAVVLNHDDTSINGDVIGKVNGKWYYFAQVPPQ